MLSEMLSPDHSFPESSDSSLQGSAQYHLQCTGLPAVSFHHKPEFCELFKPKLETLSHCLYKYLMMCVGGKQLEILIFVLFHVSFNVTFLLVTSIHIAFKNYSVNSKNAKRKENYVLQPPGFSVDTYMFSIESHMVSFMERRDLERPKRWS